MISDQMREFNTQLIEEVKEYSQTNQLATSEAFTSIYLAYLADADETRTADCEVLTYKKASKEILINGYAYNDYFKTLTIVVSDYSPRPQVQRIGKVESNKLLKQATKFFRYCKTDYFLSTEEAGQGYQAFECIKSVLKDVETLNVILLTNKEAVLSIPNDIHIDTLLVKYDIWDLERVCQSVFQKKMAEPLVIRLESKYGEKLPLIKVEKSNDIYDCYVGAITGNLLANIYRDEGQKLIEKNVRSYLQALGKVNKGIKKTIAQEPEMFMAYNNGISTIADSIEIDAKESSGAMTIITEITGWQIVNGGQTTASIYNALRNKFPLESVTVQMKLSVIKDQKKANEIIGNISRYANSQNEIKMSDFSANDDYHIAMERLSRTVYIPTDKGKATYRWFYERARGQYSVEMSRQSTPSAKRRFQDFNPKSKKVDKTDAARCLMLWLRKPNLVAKGKESNFVVFNEMIKKGEVEPPSEKSYKSMIAKVILFNECNKVVAAQKFGDWKAQQNYYTIALLSEYNSEIVDDEYIWKHQTISPELALKIEELAYKVWNHFMKPEIQGVNVGQWCKKEECWTLLKKRFEADRL